MTALKSFEDFPAYSEIYQDCFLQPREQLVLFTLDKILGYIILLLS